MSDVTIVVIDGVRYREDDAKRRGLLQENAPTQESEAPASGKEPAEPVKAKQPANKAAVPAAK